MLSRRSKLTKLLEVANNSSAGYLSYEDNRYYTRKLIFTFTFMSTTVSSGITWILSFIGSKYYL